MRGKDKCSILDFSRCFMYSYIFVRIKFVHIYTYIYISHIQAYHPRTSILLVVVFR